MFVSGIDPGWALDILPALVSGVGAGITEIRVQELFNYALYDQPDVVREVIGFGGPMDELPLMLLDFSLHMVWAPTLRILADLLGVELERDRRSRSSGARWSARSRSPAWARSRPGTQGAFRFEVRGIVDGRPLLVVEHVDPHRRRLRARLAALPRRRAASTGCCSAATRTSRSRPRHRGGRARRGRRRQRHRGQPHRQRHPGGVRAPAGPLSPLDLPPITGAAQLALPVTGSGVFPHRSCN